jgi:hypothetical protein
MEFLKVAPDVCLCDECLMATLRAEGISALEAVRAFLEIARQENARRARHEGQGQGQGARAPITVGLELSIPIGRWRYPARIVERTPTSATLEYRLHCPPHIARRVTRSIAWVEERQREGARAPQYNRGGAERPGARAAGARLEGARSPEDPGAPRWRSREA